MNIFSSHYSHLIRCLNEMRSLQKSCGAFLVTFHYDDEASEFFGEHTIRCQTAEQCEEGFRILYSLILKDDNKLFFKKISIPENNGTYRWIKEARALGS